MRYFLFACYFCMGSSLAAETIRLSESVEATEGFEVFGAPMGDKSPGLRLSEVIAREDELSGKTVADIGFGKFTKSGFWNVDEVLRPICKATGEEMGREYPYPGDE